MAVPPWFVLLALPMLASAESNETGSDTTNDDGFDVYTIVAIVLLSSLGLLLVVRLLRSCFGCRVAREEKKGLPIHITAATCATPDVHA